MILSFIFTWLLSAMLANPAHAATFTVNSRYDLNDLSPGNGLCVAYLVINPPFVLPFCTLRAAIEESNSLPGQDTIILSGGTYQLDLDGAGEDISATGDLDIIDSLVIVGAGPENTFIDGGGLDRVLDIIESNITVTISGITITNGFLPVNLQTNQKGGGGIRNAGTLSFKNSSIINNHVQGLADEDTGGGLFNIGTCSIINSTIRNNSAKQGGGVVNENGATLQISESTICSNNAERGGGIINYGSITATNTTFSSNIADTGNYPVGGAIQNWNECTLIHSTIAENIAPLGGGGISNDGTLSMVNTIVSDNAGGDCRLVRSIDSKGYNIASDHSCYLSRALGDLENTEPLLGPLQDNGGVTPTHALSQNSPAIDAGILLANVSIDQRGIKRPQRETSDIGAYEIEPISIVPFISPLLLK
ncbi:MAG: hypothetical protein OEM01_04710 [Desulfobulbaceae bacterium]|nr:hypothetical protein [Desulfobulbaceae bacterium]